jgi:hypothetical protein
MSHWCPALRVEFEEEIGQLRIQGGDWEHMSFCSKGFSHSNIYITHQELI